MEFSKKLKLLKLTSLIDNFLRLANLSGGSDFKFKFPSNFKTLSIFRADLLRLLAFYTLQFDKSSYLS